jgi:hypothetical protein
MEMYVVDRTSMDFRFGNRQAAKHAQTMFLRKIGKIALVDQLDDVPIRPVPPGRDELLLVRGMVVTMMVVVIVIVVVIPIILFVLVIMILVMFVF